MTLTARIGRTTALALAVLGFAAPSAAAGVDRGIDVQPYVAPAPDALDRYLANDRRHANSGAPASPGRQQTDSAWSDPAIAVLGVGSLVLGIVAATLAIKRRTRLAS